MALQLHRQLVRMEWLAPDAPMSAEASLAFEREQQGAQQQQQQQQVEEEQQRVIQNNNTRKKYENFAIIAL
mgnify:CR=1 FL=1